MSKKKYVSVLVYTNEDGNKIPKEIVYNEQKFVIDRVIGVKNCASFKVGGIGERYNIVIGDKTTYLFYENGKWFVEEK